ncbi:MAG TPA: hypothetical protein VFG47_01920 [Geminicoccaceae bacterium]|nr:hypothetical protein [Geminicoccaceae bacterium]
MNKRAALTLATLAAIPAVATGAAGDRPAVVGGPARDAPGYDGDGVFAPLPRRPDAPGAPDIRGDGLFAQLPRQPDAPGYDGDGLFAQLPRRPDAPGAPDIQRRPGAPEAPPPQPAPPVDPGAVSPPPPDAFPDDFAPVPDRWRLMEDLGVRERWYDPYNQNTLKGDRPIFGEDWFIVLSAISDTVVEPRSTPVPVAIQSGGPGAVNVFGDPEQFLFSETIIGSVSLIKGDTAFRPQDIELRLTGAYNYNYATAEERRFLTADPGRGTTRTDWHFGLQEAFLDYHIRNVSDRYDFDSVRLGIQPFTTDFRGFLFQDNQLGVRLFGTRDNNIYQYNLAWFRRVEKELNSGLNDVTEDLREDDVFVANLYRQDFPILGLTSQAVAVYNRNRDDPFVDPNGFPARPSELGFGRVREYDVGYFGLNFDGRIGWLNLTASGYFATGENRNSPLSDRETDIEAFFLAAEPSVDFDWVRLRLSGLYASGDDDPYDDKDRGFDAIFENPLFAGADTSYWIRQAVPFIGGGFVGLNGRNGVLPSLRSSKELGQSNFTNPGLTLLGVGADFDILPELRLSFNANYLRFNDTAVLEALRQQGDIDEEIGWDLSSAVIWRPLLNQNIVLRLSGAVLLPGDGFDDLFGSEDDDDFFYSVLANVVITY